MASQPVNFTLGFKTRDVNQYELTAPNDNLLSKTVFLNGQKIKNPSPDLPNLVPKIVQRFQMEPFSFSFWTVSLPNGNGAC